MAYTTTNPPALIIRGGMDGNQMSTWNYKSTDTGTTAHGSGYFTNGGLLGMKIYDLVYVNDTTTPQITSHMVTVVNATTGAVTISTPTIIGTSS